MSEISRNVCGIIYLLNDFGGDDIRAEDIDRMKSRGFKFRLIKMAEWREKWILWLREK